VIVHPQPIHPALANFRRVAARKCRRRFRRHPVKQAFASNDGQRMPMRGAVMNKMEPQAVDFGPELRMAVDARPNDRVVRRNKRFE
jgi:hypothetical protein